MACIINASVSSGLVSSADTSGNIQLQWNGQAAPAFSANAGAVTQSLPATTVTKLIFGTEDYDTNNNFASSRFTPTVAGYYQISGGYQNSSTATETVVYIYKNGSIALTGLDSSSAFNAYMSGLVYCNGSTDYIELYAYVGTAKTTTGSASQNYFQGVLIRGA